MFWSNWPMPAVDPWRAKVLMPATLETIFPVAENSRVPVPDMSIVLVAVEAPRLIALFVTSPVPV